MSNKTLVSFTRSTKAWLDGVEYGIDIPRYDDGKLLIEIESENLIPDSRYILGMTDFISGTADVNIVGAAIIVNAATGKNLAIKHFATGDFTLSFIAKGSGTLRTRPIASGDIVVTELSDTFQPVRITVPQSQAAETVYLFDDVTYDNLVNVTIIDLQVEPGTVATSYIPTNGTAITRAADIATVRDK